MLLLLLLKKIRVALQALPIVAGHIEFVGIPQDIKRIKTLCFHMVRRMVAEGTELTIGIGAGGAGEVQNCGRITTPGSIQTACHT